MVYWRRQALTMEWPRLALSDYDYHLEEPMAVVHPYDVAILLMFVLGFIVPILLGFFWIRPDANTRGQPGLLWALLTIPLSWIAVLVYLVVRALAPQHAAQ